jgi:hypothetical protein
LIDLCARYLAGSPRYPYGLICDHARKVIKVACGAEVSDDWLALRSRDVTCVYEGEHVSQQTVGDSVGFDQLLLS